MPDEKQAKRSFITTTVEIEGREEKKIVELPAFEPAPWDASAELHIVGQRVPRVDAREKVTGRARYTADIARPGMLHAVLVRAPITCGRVTAIDVAPALAIPGVVDAITAADLPKRPRVRGVALLDATVLYPGQPVAAVCAESLAAARRGAEAVRLTIESSPFVIAAEQAILPDAPRLRPKGNLTRSSPRTSARGDVERGLAEAEVVVEREYRTQSALHTALEPHGSVAEWEGDRLTIWESTQGIFATRENVATGLELPLGAVRVIKDYMGGGFGAKNSAGVHTFIAAILARRLARPVRCINDREGEQLDSGHRPPTIQRVTLGARRDGRLTAIVLDADIALGVGGWEGGPAKIYHEMYACPNVRTTERFVYVNGQAMDSFRAPGHVEGAFGLECAMDALARTLDLDPLELRIRNFAERDQEKDRPYSANQLLACYREGAERFGWRARRTAAVEIAEAELEQRAAEREELAGSSGAPLPSSGTRVVRGVGVASQVWGTGGGPPAYALVKINGDGTADVLTGTQDLGTGSRTIFAQIAAEALGARLADVRVVLGDTERTPYTGNSWGSMTTASVGPAVRMAAEDARAHLLEAAAQMLGVEPHALRARDGIISVIDGDRSMSFCDVCQQLGDVMIIGRGSRGPNPTNVALMSFGAQFAEVEVDLDTGRVRVVRIVAVHDAGRIINPMLAESQLEGGIIQGLGYALFEERKLDPATGLPLNPDMHDYKIPTLADIPPIDAFFVHGADPTANHTGARGLAEPPIIPTAPAIANAVADAIGVEIGELPITPWRVLRAIA